MVGGFSTPKKDKSVKVSGGQCVKKGTLLARGRPAYKAGINVQGMSNLIALSEGQVYFTRKKTSHGKFRTFINIAPVAQKA